MSRIKTFARPRTAAIIGIAAGLAAFVVPTVAQAAPPEGQVKVMSRNLYLGADLTGALEATNSFELALATQEIWNSVITTEFPNRAKLLAKEIKDTKPDLVGLQEVALWRADYDSDPAPGGTQDGPTTPATTVEYDFLSLLMKELRKQGADYRIVRQQKEADIEAPLAGYAPGCSDPEIEPITERCPGDGRLTMRDVVIARDDKQAKVKTKFDFSQRFDKEDSLTIEDIGGVVGFDVTVWRGFVAVDANVRGTKFRFVDTHFEAFDNTAKLAQAEALVQGLPEELGPANPDAVEVPVVLVGDLNSDNEIVEDEGDTPQHQADELPYAAVVDAGLEERSFDGPEEDAIDDAVYGCCFSDDLIGEPPPGALVDIDHNIDKVMVSDDDHGVGVDPNGNDVELVDSFPVGADPDQFFRFDRWASDHLGTFSKLQFPTP